MRGLQGEISAKSLRNKRQLGIIGSCEKVSLEQVFTFYF